MSGLTEDWMEKYNALVQFGIENGHCNATYRHSVTIPGSQKPFKLGCFVVVQRKDYASGKLDPMKIELLQKLVNEGKFDWNPVSVSARSDRTWPIMFNALHEFCSVAQRKPVTSIPENLIYRNHEGISIKLGRWMHTQNKLHRNNKLRNDRVMRFHTDLINTGLFQWPVTRGSRTFKPQIVDNYNTHHNMLSNDPTLLLSKSDLHPITSEVYSTSSRGIDIHLARQLHRQAIQQQQQQQHHQLFNQQIYQNAYSQHDTSMYTHNMHLLSGLASNNHQQQQLQQLPLQSPPMTIPMQQQQQSQQSQQLLQQQQQQQQSQQLHHQQSSSQHQQQQQTQHQLQQNIEDDSDSDADNA